MLKHAILIAPLALAGCTHSPRWRAPSQPVIREVGQFEREQCTGVAVSKSGRIFVSFPLWHDGHTVHVAEVNPNDGSYFPYPDQVWNDWNETKPIMHGMGPDHFVCVQALYVDDLDRLWVLDPASPRMQGIAPNARPKLVRFNLTTNQPERLFFFDSTIAPDGSYLNDVRIDTRTGQAYMTDSGLGAIVIQDINTGIARRVLAGHFSVMAEPGVVPAAGGNELFFAGGPMEGKPLVAHADGIALDSARGYLYWQALTGRTLYRIRTADLNDASLSEAQLADRIELVGETPFTDGLEIDARGNIYFSDFEHDAVVARRPNGDFFTVAQSPLFSWPDSFALGADGSLYVTCARIHETPWFNEGGVMPSPFRVFKMPQYKR